jgi:DNA repair ATPase RecN
MSAFNMNDPFGLNKFQQTVKKAEGVASSLKTIKDNLDSQHGLDKKLGESSGAIDNALKNVTGAIQQLDKKVGDVDEQVKNLQVKTEDNVAKIKDGTNEFKKGLTLGDNPSDNK